MIDYILEQTNETQLIYIGHSQGVASVFVLLSELPEYNKNIAMVHAMTPPVICKYIHPLLPIRSIKETNTLQVSNF